VTDGDDSGGGGGGDDDASKSTQISPFWKTFSN
jgi:hypothetical protein